MIDSMLQELVPNIFWMPPDHATDRPVLAAIAGKRATLMVDAGASVKHARQFLDALAATTAPPLRHLVLTHSHWDHVFGASAVEAIAIATDRTRRRVATMATHAWSDAALDERVGRGIEIPFCRDMIKAELSPAERADLTVRVPEMAFETEMVIDLGGRTVRLIHVGGDHAPDSCIVVVPGVAAFMGDCAYRNLHVEPNYLTRRRLFPLLDRLLTLDVAWYVMGHDDAPLSRVAFESLARTLKTIGEAVGRGERDDGAIGEAVAGSSPGLDAATVSGFVDAFRGGLPHEVG